jgi:signal transduction histidine kinase
VGAPKSPVERDDTNRSLYAERDKTDVELGKISARVEREADAVVDGARKDTDVAQRAARIEGDSELRDAGASAEVVAAAHAGQRLADDSLTAERKAMDDEIGRERGRRDRAIGLLLRVERGRTDTHLSLERAQADAALVEILAELADAMKLRDEFLSVASHELNTPLTPIKLSLHQLAKEAAGNPGSALAESVSRYVVIANRQIGRLSTLVAELVDVAHLSSRGPVVHLARIDLGPIVRGVGARYQMDAQRAGCPLTVDASDGVMGEWDALRIDQAVANLLENAIKFGAGKPVRVRLRATATGAQISVADEGIGVAVEDRARIFERFARAVSERNYGGLGLGLYIARSNVEALGGRIEVGGDAGRGATFTVELPATP